ncbi:unnamed protein product [Brassicogethes aeneus]|uniref:Uncharacterized protein n=1 Tax=Brassicogethes aeneus TaxID=1431903 RepID=A0A9P0B0U5_BRAAE|nr:unnamed protein product [Brassicogethes aeneus]
MIGLLCSWCFIKLVLGVAIILSAIKIYCKLTIGWCRSQACLTGKTAIVTGANTGIGYETALDLAKRGAKVILACRNKHKAEEACEKMKNETDNHEIYVKIVDFTSFESVRKFANDINKNEHRLDILVNNAGAGGLGDKYIGEDKLQILMMTNYYSHFLITNLLLGLLMKTGNSRVVNVSSIAAKYGKIDLYNLNFFENNIKVYNTTKLCNILFTIELASKLKGTTVTTYSLHPGVVDTDLFRQMPPWMLAITKFIGQRFFKSNTEGAQTTIHCAVQKNLEALSGEHFHDCHPVERYRSVDEMLCKDLWNKTEEIVKLTLQEKPF